MYNVVQQPCEAALRSAFRSVYPAHHLDTTVELDLAASTAPATELGL